MTLNAIGYWTPTHATSYTTESVNDDELAMLCDFRRTLYLVFDAHRHRLALRVGGQPAFGEVLFEPHHNALPLVAVLPPLYPEWLGDPTFQSTHHTRFNYVGGSMARGIASAQTVIELAQVGMLGFFGAAGLSPQRVEKEILSIKAALQGDGLVWGANLIHSPQQPGLEEAITELYLKHGVARVETSAFMNLTPSVVRYSVAGLYRDQTGKICRQTHIFAKISREEVARHFLSPAPEKILEVLYNKGQITSEQFEMARQVPLAEDITVESDSGGHTDNRPLNALFPAIVRLRDQLAAHYNYDRQIRIGAAGSLGTPEAIAAAFALGAAYVLLGSVHQGCCESGLSADGRALLAQAGIADVAMTASADMFEMGVKVQVLKKGILMPMRGNELYDIYSRYNSLEEIPASIRQNIEKNIFRASLDEIWQETVRYFEEIDPKQIAEADINPKHRMALVFRWYLGNSSRWPLKGDADRRLDYQIWCGPAMGSFNRWVAGSFLEKADSRHIKQVALNLIDGAAQITRAHQVRTYGIKVPNAAFCYFPRKFEL